MQTQDVISGSMTYSFVGNGVASSALGLHEYPSDLDIYLFFALQEYLSVTGDFDFLSESIPFHPKNSSSFPPGAQGYTVLDHIRVAFTHLNTSVGLGPHGLLKIGDGDWDDGVVYLDPSPLAVAFTIENGESVPNSQLAIFVLPELAETLETIDSVLSDQMLQLSQTLNESILQVYGSRWFGRAWMRDSFNREYLRVVLYGHFC